MRGQQPQILTVLVTIIVDVIMLLVVGTTTITFWIAFVGLTIGGLLFLVPLSVKPAHDYMTRIPVFILLGLNYIAQIVLVLFSHVINWRVMIIIELILILAVAGITLFSEQRNDEANAKLANNDDAKYIPRQGSF